MGRPSLSEDDRLMLNAAAREGLFSQAFQGKRVALSGTMSMSRKDIVSVIKAAGGRWDETTRSGTDYLVVGDTGAHGMTAKIDAAVKLGIEILEEHEFAAMLTVVDLS